MDSTTQIILALIAIIAGFGAIIKLMWNSQNRLAERVIDVVEKNATSQESLVKSVDANTKSTDNLTNIVVKIMKPNNKKR